MARKKKAGAKKKRPSGKAPARAPAAPAPAPAAPAQPAQPLAAAAARALDEEEEEQQELQLELEPAAPAPPPALPVSNGNAGPMAGGPPAGEEEEKPAAAEAATTEERDGVLVALGVFLTVAGAAVLAAAVAKGASAPRTLLVLGGTWAILLAWSNGANDAANSLGAAVGAGAVTLRQAVLLGAAAEVTGASVLGVHVSKTISKGVIRTEDYAADPHEFAFAMVYVLLGAAATTIAATYYKLPISATHGIVGGLIGVGALAHGWDSLEAPAIAKTVASWVVSPVLGAAVALLLFLAVHFFVFRAGDPRANSERMQPFFTGLTVFIVALFLMLKGPPQLHFWRPNAAWVPLVVSLGVAALAVFLTAFRTLYAEFGRAARAATAADHDYERLESGEKGQAAAGEGAEEDGAGAAERPFNLLLTLTSLSVAFAHGANDVANSAGPFAALLEGAAGAVHDQPDIPLWVVVAAGSCMSVGILTWGHKTIGTVSNKITALSPSKAFAVQLGAAVSVLTSSVFELPVSTSHCLVGAVIGVGAAEALLGKGGRIDFQVLRRIVVSWVITIPLAMAIACAVFAVGRRAV